MADNRYHRNSGSVYVLKYHLVWCPKYRRKVLTDLIADELRLILFEVAASLDVEIEALEIMPDHVHIFVSSSPTLAPQHIVNQFKGVSSRILRDRHPELKSRLPSLWSRSYYIGSIGHVSEETVRAYIEAQRRS